jgi:hypothetical protein
MGIQSYPQHQLTSLAQVGQQFKNDTYTSTKNLICDNGPKDLVPTNELVQTESSNPNSMNSINNKLQLQQNEYEQKESSSNKENFVGINIE